jgi:hypothetical protein
LISCRTITAIMFLCEFAVPGLCKWFTTIAAGDVTQSQHCSLLHTGA